MHAVVTPAADAGLGSTAGAERLRLRDLDDPAALAVALLRWLAATPVALLTLVAVIGVLAAACWWDRRQVQVGPDAESAESTDGTGWFWDDLDSPLPGAEPAVQVVPARSHALRWPWSVGVISVTRLQSRRHRAA